MLFPFILFTFEILKVTGFWNINSVQTVKNFLGKVSNLKRLSRINWLTCIDLKTVSPITTKTLFSIYLNFLYLIFYGIPNDKHLLTLLEKNSLKFKKNGANENVFNELKNKAIKKNGHEEKLNEISWAN